MSATSPISLQLVEQPAFRAVIMKYVAYACRHGRVKPADFEDVVQQIWAEVALGTVSFRPEKGTFDNWVRCIALNVIRHHVRDKKRYEKRFCEYRPTVVDHVASDPSPERCLQRKEARILISGVLDELSEQQANVLLLHAIDDLSHGEISINVGMSEAATQKCFQRTRDKLAQCLSSELLAVPPPFLAVCDDRASGKTVSRWSERSHYATQAATAILAILLSFSVKSTPNDLETKGQPFVRGVVKNDEMYHFDKQIVAQDEPTARQSAPTGKPETANLPSAHVVPKLTGAVDKPAPVKFSPPRTPYRHSPRPMSHRPHG